MPTEASLRGAVLRAKRDRALILLGFAAALRRSELAATCPVRAVRSYLAAASAALSDQGRPSPLFRKIDRWGRLGTASLSGSAIAKLVKTHAARAGLDPALYAGHSLRAGFATTAARAGKPDRAIQKQTRHKSAAMLAEYVREGRLFDENASEGIGL